MVHHLGLGSARTPRKGFKSRSMTIAISRSIETAHSRTQPAAMVVVGDDEDRENEGRPTSCELVPPRAITFHATHGPPGFDLLADDRR